MNPSEWGTRQPVLTGFIFAVLCVAGVIGFRHLPLSDMPTVVVPIIAIETGLQGATPSEIETRLTRRIEESVVNVGGIKHVDSVVENGSSVTTVEFEGDQNRDQAIQSIRDAVERIRGELPAETIGPEIAPVTMSDVLLSYSIESSLLDEADLSWFVDSEVNRKLVALKGVARISRNGGVTREIHVDIDPARIDSLGLSGNQVSERLRAALKRQSAGAVSVSGTLESVTIDGGNASLDAIGKLTIPFSDGGMIRVDQIAKITDTIASPRQYAFLNGRRVVGFDVYRTEGASEVAVAAEVRRAVDALVAAHPGLRITEVANNAGFIDATYHEAMKAIYLGCLLAVAVIWLFMRDARATLVSAVALPLAVVPTFFVMKILGFSLNQLTLLALTLVIGVLVDDAIVEVENIMQHLARGKAPAAAALDAAREVGLAVIATSLTLVAVFLPTSFLGGVIGQYFREFGFTASIAVLFSLLVARVLTPFLAAHILRPIAREAVPGRLATAYRKSVGFCLTHYKAVTFASVLYVIASVLMLTSVPKGFLPARDLSRIKAQIRSATGGTSDAVLQAVDTARRLGGTIPEVASVYTIVGGPADGASGEAARTSSDTTFATVAFSLNPLTQRRLTQQEIQNTLVSKLAAIPAVQLSFGSSSAGDDLSLVLSSADSQLLEQTARDLQRQLLTLPGVGAVMSSAGVETPERIIKPNYALAALLGVPLGELTESVRVAAGSEDSRFMPTLNLSDRQVPVRIELDPARLDPVDPLSTVRVRARDTSVALSSVANVAATTGAARIERHDHMRSVTLTLELNGRPLGAVLDEAQKLPVLAHLPAGVERADVGESESLSETFASFFYAMLGGLLSIYCVLVLLFRGALRPLSIMSALPLSLGGVALALHAARLDLSLASLIGLLMLMGITTKNSILLVDRIVKETERSVLGIEERILCACDSRVRPIVMTTVAMVCGMIPIAMDCKADSFRATMAVTVIGGLTSSTILSLFVVPVAFKWFWTAGNWVKTQPYVAVRKAFAFLPFQSVWTNSDHTFREQSNRLSAECKIEDTSN